MLYVLLLPALPLEEGADPRLEDLVRHTQHGRHAQLPVARGRRDQVLDCSHVAGSA